MANENKGQPSGTNKNEGTGVPVKMPPEGNQQTEKQSERYTDGADEIRGDIRQRHPNRNTDKDVDDGPPYS